MPDALCAYETPIMEGGWAERTCRFERICYDHGLASFVFYTGESEADGADGVDAVLLYDTVHGPITNLSGWLGAENRRDHGRLSGAWPFVSAQVRSLPLGSATDPNSFMPLQTRRGTPPPPQKPQKANPEQSSAAVWVRGTTVFLDYYVPQNIGHFLEDNVFSMLQALLAVGRPEAIGHARVLLHRSCAKRYGTTDATAADMAQRCEAFEAAFWPLVADGGEALLYLQREDNETDTTPSTPSIRRQSLAGSGRSGRHRGLTCFEELVVGNSHLGFSTNRYRMNKGINFWLLRQRLLERFGLDPAAQPTQHRIVLVEKRSSVYSTEGSHPGQRRIANVAEAAAHLRQRWAAAGVAVDLVSWEGMALAAQLRLLVSTTLLITPCGGISMLALALPPGAHALFMDYPIGKLQVSGNMEGTMLWDQLFHIRPMYYQIFSKHDFVLDGEDETSEGKAKELRNHANIVLDMTRLDELVDAAMARMSL